MLVEVVMEARWTPWFLLDKSQHGHTHWRSLHRREQASHEGLDGPTGRKKLLAKVTRPNQKGAINTSLWACQFRLKCISLLKVQNIILAVPSTCAGIEQTNLTNLVGLSSSGRSCTCRSRWCGSRTVWKLTFLCCGTVSWQRHPILRHTTAHVQ